MAGLDSSREELSKKNPELEEEKREIARISAWEELNKKNLELEEAKREIERLRSKSRPKPLKHTSDYEYIKLGTGTAKNKRTRKKKLQKMRKKIRAREKEENLAADSNEISADEYQPTSEDKSPMLHNVDSEDLKLQQTWGINEKIKNDEMVSLDSSREELNKKNPEFEEAKGEIERLSAREQLNKNNLELDKAKTEIERLSSQSCQQPLQHTSDYEYIKLGTGTAKNKRTRKKKLQKMRKKIRAREKEENLAEDSNEKSAPEYQPTSKDTPQMLQNVDSEEKMYTSKESKELPKSFLRPNFLSPNEGKIIPDVNGYGFMSMSLDAPNFEQQLTFPHGMLIDQEYFAQCGGLLAPFPNNAILYPTREDESSDDSSDQEISKQNSQFPDDFQQTSFLSSNEGKTMPVNGQQSIFMTSYAPNFDQQHNFPHDISFPMPEARLPNENNFDIKCENGFYAKSGGTVW